MELLVATTNKKKLEEIREFLKGLNVKVLSLADCKNPPEVEEDGKTFSANAIKKAVTLSMYTGKLTLGEDSGLQVKALCNEPGIYSARYSGAGATDKKNNLKLLRALKGTPFKARQARYRCCMALADKKGIVDVVSGSCRGFIALRSSGTNGFGYDPLFFVPRYKKTFGKISPEIKSKISHRACAFRKLRRVIEKYLASPR
ncbi:MAG: RdgB/HAM1 family non-canonical purine NTP pyrophosphatase [Candidatus Omnitrophota bacterium]